MSYTKLRQTLAEALETAYQVPEEDIATMLPEDETGFDESGFKSKFLELDKTRISTINQKGKDKFEQGYSKAKKEERTKFESEIKEAFSLEDEDSVGIDLINKILEANSTGSKPDVSKLTEEELKKHPGVIRMLSEKDRSFKEQETKIKDEYETKIKGFHREQMITKVSKKALDIFEGMNPVLSDDPKRASNQKNVLLKELSNFDYQESETGDDYIPLKDGKRLENAHGHGTSFESHIKSLAESFFDFKQADPRGTPPGGGDPGGSGKPTGAPKTEAEYTKVMADRSIPLEDRKKIQESWNKSKV